MDSLLVEEAWRGKVAIKFILASQDLSAPVAPDPVFLLCSRYGYITKSAQIAVEHFRSYAMDVQSEIWFESSGCPLKCQLPIGVLHDMYYARQQQQIVGSQFVNNSSSTGVDNKIASTQSVAATSTIGNNSGSGELTVGNTTTVSSHIKEGGIGSTTLGGPWEVVVHFRRYPYDQLLRFDGDRAKEQFQHSMKQALHLLHGSARAFTGLPLEKRADMWEGACTGVYSLFAPGFREIIPPRDAVRHMPVRLVKHGAPANQKPVTVFTSTVTVADTAATDGSASGAGMRETTLGDVVRSFLSTLASDGNENELSEPILIHGIQVPPQAGIYDVWSTMCSADLFLYLVLPYK